jgi:hypothetical protein
MMEDLEKISKKLVCPTANLVALRAEKRKGCWKQVEIAEPEQ